VELGLRKSFKIVAPGRSLRRRVGYSLAIVRLILVPVIFLAVYSLYAMGLIVDRIVSADAPVARLAERASVEMLDARRAERNYFLLRDPQYLKTNQRWYTYTGTTPEQMEGWGWQSVHDPQMLPLVLERWKTSIATGEPFDMVFPRNHRGISYLSQVWRWRLTPCVLSLVSI
jgi:PAS domain-containing protein